MFDGQVTYEGDCLQSLRQECPVRIFYFEMTVLELTDEACMIGMREGK